MHHPHLPATRATPRRGLTLVELLIAVTIVALLAVIAIGYFQGSQVRAKVARSRSNQRVVAQALESYSSDHNSYPTSLVKGDQLPLAWIRWVRSLTTPVGYLTSVASAEDPYKPSGPATDRIYTFTSYADTVWSDNTGLGRLQRKHGNWKLDGFGPITQIITPEDADRRPLDAEGDELPYDPTNGTSSPGFLIKSHRGG